MTRSYFVELDGLKITVHETMDSKSSTGLNGMQASVTRRVMAACITHDPRPPDDIVRVLHRVVDAWPTHPLANGAERRDCVPGPGFVRR